MGQMMEPAELPPFRELKTDVPDWAVAGAKDRKPNLICSLNIGAEDHEMVNMRLLNHLEQNAEK